MTHLILIRMPPSLHRFAYHGVDGRNVIRRSYNSASGCVQNVTGVARKQKKVLKNVFKTSPQREASESLLLTVTVSSKRACVWCVVLLECDVNSSSQHQAAK